MKAAITGVAGYLPEKIITNHDLAKIVDTNDEWIVSRTGIKERRRIAEGEATSDMAARAVTRLLEKTNTKPEEIDVIICGTVTPDTVMPDTANYIALKTGLVNAFGFDINAACSGFIYTFTVGCNFIQTGLHKKVIVVGADTMSTIIDPEDRTTCIIFGDGAAAVLLEPSNVGCIDSVLKSDGSGREFLHIKAGGSAYPITNEALDKRDNYVYQNGRPVFKRAVLGMSEAIQEVLERNNLTKEDIAWIVPHQANIRIIEGVANHLEFPMEKVMVTIHKYGNTTAATIPLCLRDYEDQLKKGDKVILTAFGGGFTWGAVLIEWAY